MSFSIDRFYQLNRRVLIWVILIAVLWLLRDFFGLIFITFVLAFIATPVVQFLTGHTPLPYRPALILVYVFFVLVLGSFIRYVTPGVIGEASRFLANAGEVQSRLVEVERGVSEDYPGLERFLHGYMRSLLDEQSLADLDRELDRYAAGAGLTEAELAEYVEGNEEMEPHLRARVELYNQREAELLVSLHMARQVGYVQEQLPTLINALYKATGTVLLGLLFSFLILFDSGRLGRQMKTLYVSRLRDFYEEVAQPVVRFTYVVGRTIQAQAMIAGANTLLTLIGLLILGIPSLALLSLIVFVCSFIPVLGVIISTIPMVLVALNAGGLNLALGAIGMVVVIHALEAYVLNPMIYGKHMKLNPVLVLIILLVAYHSFGLWGMILGVPVSYYFIHDVFGVPLWDEKRLRSQAAAQVTQGDLLEAGDE